MLFTSVGWRTEGYLPAGRPGCTGEQRHENDNAASQYQSGPSCECYVPHAGLPRSHTPQTKLPPIITHPSLIPSPTNHPLSPTF